MKYAKPMPAGLFPFGKFEAHSISAAICADLRYCTWCLTLPAIAQRHPEFVTRLRRAVAEAQLRQADAEEAARRAAVAKAAPHLADLL